MINPRQIVFRCETCHHKNRVEFGVDNFELLTETFESLTEAWEHLMEDVQNPHYIVAEEQD